MNPFAKIFNINRNKEKTIENDRRLSNDYLRNGNAKAKRTIIIDEEDNKETSYSGWLYAALNVRADNFASFCEESVMPAFDVEDENVTVNHPYIKMIENSQRYEEYDFWHDILADYDIFGEYFIFILRRVVYEKDPKTGKQVLTYCGEPQSIEVLDAGNMTVLKNGYGEVVGYKEQVDSTHYREFSVDQIIHRINKNPMNKELPYSIFDAARDYQYTINKGSDYAKAALINNINTPAIISSQQELSPDEYDNLVARISQHEAGKPIVANGAGAIDYKETNQSLDKASLPSLNEINRQTIYAITGTSKTILGIEESGTTRETARVQDKKFTQKTILPLAKRVVGSLNLDFRIHYPEAVKKYNLKLDIKDLTDPEDVQEKLTTQKLLFDDITEIVYSGYTAQSAEDFMYGDISYTALVPDEDSSQDETEEDVPGGINSPEEEEEEEPVDETPKETMDGAVDLKESDKLLVPENFVRNYVHDKNYVSDLIIEENATPKGNPHHDKVGKFTYGPYGEYTGLEKTTKLCQTMNKLLEKQYKKREKMASMASDEEFYNQWQDLKEKSGEVIKNYIEANGGDYNKLMTMESDWVGNDYKTIEDHIKNKDSKELELMNALQQAYFHEAGIKEITLERGVYGDQAKKLKEAQKSGKSIDLGPDYATSFTGDHYAAVDYADGASFTAPDDISDSVVIKKTIPVDQIVYSTEVLRGKAGSLKDEFIVTMPKGMKIDPSDIEVINSLEDVVTNNIEDEHDFSPKITEEHQGWVGAKVTPIEVSDRLSDELKIQLADESLMDAEQEATNSPGQENPHFTVVYGLKEEAYKNDIKKLFKDLVPKEVEIESIEKFDLDNDDSDVIVAKVKKTPELEAMNKAFLELPHYDQKFPDYTPHVSLVYVKKDADDKEIIDSFQDLVGKKLKVAGADYGKNSPMTTNQKEIDFENHTHDGGEFTIDDHINSVFSKRLNDLGELDDYSKTQQAQLIKAKETLLKGIRKVQLLAIQKANNKVAKNAIERSDVISEDDENSLIENLYNLFRQYWFLALPVIGKNRIQDTSSELGKKADVNLMGTASIKKWIDETSRKAATSHVNTIFKDIVKSANKAENKIVTDLFTEKVQDSWKKGNKWFDEKPTASQVKTKMKDDSFMKDMSKVYKSVQSKIDKGYNRFEIQKAIRNEYVNLSRKRANTIVNNEIARSISNSQYMADYEFLKKLNLLDKSYKRLVSSTGSPCPICENIVDEGWIPFTSNFINYGDTITVDNGSNKTISFTASYEAIRNGVVHVNCKCYYELEIRR